MWEKLIYRNKHTIKKAVWSIIGIVVLLLITGILPIPNFSHKDKVLSPEEQVVQRHQNSQMMLVYMANSEKETADKALAEKNYNDCIRAAIARDEDVSLFSASWIECGKTSSTTPFSEP